MHGIDGDQRLGQIKLAEQDLHRWDLVRLVLAVQMRQHQPGVRGEGGNDELYCRFLALRRGELQAKRGECGTLGG